MSAETLPVVLLGVVLLESVLLAVLVPGEGGELLVGVDAAGDVSEGVSVGDSVIDVEDDGEVVGLVVGDVVVDVSLAE